MGVPIVERASGIRLCAGYVGYAFIFAGAIVMVPLSRFFFPEERVLAPCFIFPAWELCYSGTLFASCRSKGFEKGRLKKAKTLFAITALDLRCGRFSRCPS